MNFRPELAAKVMAHRKTVTRRRMSDNPRSPWFKDGCSLVVGHDYAVCPGRGKNAIGRVRVLAITQTVLGDVDFDEARREGFRDLQAFKNGWAAINRGYDPMEGGGVKQSELKRKTELRADPEKVRGWQRRSRAKSPTKRRPISAASKEQRGKVRDRPCVNCAAPGPCDPAHLTSRAQGGCDDPACCIPLCRECHVGLDSREGPQAGIDLEPVLALPEFAAERAHMASHLTYRQCMQRLTGERA